MTDSEGGKPIDKKIKATGSVSLDENSAISQRSFMINLEDFYEIERRVK